jgi:threonine dehydrogenase-like Zn-dependent dehydrogenase
MGHENVGVIAAAGAQAVRRWGVQEGDRVVLEEYLPCGHCRFCHSSEYRLCIEADPSVTPGAFRYGRTPLSVGSGLWGGYADVMELHPNSVFHRIDPSVPAELASLALPLGNGWEWAVAEGGVGPGDVVVIFGPGQQGLGCLIAALAAGAGLVIVVGREQDAGRLAVATELGAHATLINDADLVAAVDQLTGGERADVVIDAATGGSATVPIALQLVRKRGTLVVPAAPDDPIADFDMRTVVRNCVTLRGTRGHSYHSVEWGIRTISSGRWPLERMCAMAVGLDGVLAAIDATAGRSVQTVVHAAILPSL